MTGENTMCIVQEKLTIDHNKMQTFYVMKSSLLYLSNKQRNIGYIINRYYCIGSVKVYPLAECSLMLTVESSSLPLSVV